MKIRAIDLTKKYGSKTVVNKINFEIRNGQILGLLGPNGAGKSTTIKMLSGQTEPSSGFIEIDGKQYSKVPSEFRTQIGVMPQDVIIWDSLTVKENLEFSGKIYKLSNKELIKRRDFLIDALNLKKELNTVADHLSGGFKRRLNLAITIMNNPGAVFLDEPTPGIDPQNRRFLWEYISNLKTENRSVILTDHYLDEAEKLADYVVIIDNGNVIAQGTVKELKTKYGSGDLVLIKFMEDTKESDLENFLQKLKKSNPESQLFDNTISINTSHPIDTMKYALQEVEKGGLKYEEFQLKEPTLEDIFLILTGKNIRE